MVSRRKEKGGKEGGWQEGKEKEQKTTGSLGVKKNTNNWRIKQDTI